MCILQRCHRVFVSRHDSCDSYLDVSRCTTGLVRRVGQIAAELGFEGAGRQEVLGLVLMIIEPALRHPRLDDVSLEPLVVHLEEVIAIAHIKKIEAKRVTLLEQDSFQSRSIR